jgi:glycosyltransferase involved in cell wall biosynthesis
MLGCGVDEVIGKIADGLAERGHSVDLYVSYADRETKHARLRLLDSRLLPAFLYEIHPLFFRAMVIAVRSLKAYDLIISSLYPTNLLAVIASRTNKIQHIAFDFGIPPFFTFDTFVKKVHYKLNETISYLVYNRATRVVACSDFLRDEALAHGVKSRVDVVHLHSVDLERISPSVDGASVRARHNISGPLAFHLGQFLPYKGIHLLLKIFKTVKREVPSSKLIVGGLAKKEYSSYFEHLCSMKNESVMFVGTIPPKELPKYYGACDVYVTCTLWEGILNPEPLAAGKPIVAFDVPGCRETVDDGVNGFLVRSFDLHGFAEKIILLLKDEKLRSEMGAKARRKAEAKFDFNKNLDELEMLLKKQLQQ